MFNARNRANASGNVIRGVGRRTESALSHGSCVGDEDRLFETRYENAAETVEVSEAFNRQVIARQDE